MNDIRIQAALAGILFAIWPLLMGKSNLNGTNSAIVISMVIAIGLLPFSLVNPQNLSAIKWHMAVFAGIFAAAGLYYYNTMISKAAIKDLSGLIVLMVITQTSTLALYQVIVGAGVTPMKISGFVLAGVAAALLIKG